MVIQEKKFIRSAQLPSQLIYLLEANINSNTIQAIWLDKISTTDDYILWLKVKNKKKIEETITEEIQNKLLKEKQILIVILDNRNFEISEKNQNILFYHLIRADNCLYNSKKIYKPTNLHDIASTQLIACYQAKYQLLKNISDDFIKEKLQGAWQFMIKAFANDIAYLELMLFGITYENKTLTHRILLLERFIPKMKSLFVKKDEDTYYLIDYILNDDDSGYYDNFGKSFKWIQKQLYKLVQETYAYYLDRIVNHKPLKKDTDLGVYNHELMENKALGDLKKFENVEEIYLFHQITIFDNEQSYKHFYIFIVLKDKPNKELKDYLYNIQQYPIKSVRITSIYYTRYHIQKELYEFQWFFKKAMKYKIFSSGYHPKIHWLNRKISYLDDLEFLLKQNLDTYQKDIKPILNNNENIISIHTEILRSFIAKQMQLFIFSTIIFKPQTKNLITLFNLLTYANSNFLKEFTTQELSQLSNLFNTLQTGVLETSHIIINHETFTIVDKMVFLTSKYIKAIEEV